MSKELQKERLQAWQSIFTNLSSICSLKYFIQYCIQMNILQNKETQGQVEKGLFGLLNRQHACWNFLFSLANLSYRTNSYSICSSQNRVEVNLWPTLPNNSSIELQFQDDIKTELPDDMHFKYKLKICLLCVWLNTSRELPRVKKTL